MVCIGDCIIDAQGCVGMVVDSGVTIKYKTTCFDGMEMVFVCPQDLVTTTSESFKKVYLKELRRIHGKAERDGSGGFNPTAQEEPKETQWRESGPKAFKER